MISPLDHFMSVSQSTYESIVGFGIMGSMKEISDDMNFGFILHFSYSINRCFEGWGNILRSKYDKDSTFRKKDFTNNFLGYYTDNVS